MPLSQKRVAPRQRATLPHISKPLPSDIAEYTTLPDLFQGAVDVVGLLAARSRVAPATIRAQLAAWCIGGAA